MLPTSGICSINSCVPFSRRSPSLIVVRSPFVACAFIYSQQRRWPHSLHQPFAAWSDLVPPCRGQHQQQQQQRTAHHTSHPRPHITLRGPAPKPKKSWARWPRCAFASCGVSRGRTRPHGPQAHPQSCPLSQLPPASALFPCSHSPVLSIYSSFCHPAPDRSPHLA